MMHNTVWLYHLPWKILIRYPLYIIYIFVERSVYCVFSGIGSKGFCCFFSMILVNSFLLLKCTYRVNECEMWEIWKNVVVILSFVHRSCNVLIIKCMLTKNGVHTKVIRHLREAPTNSLISTNVFIDKQDINSTLT